MFLKIHRSPETGDVVAICDRELLNTKISNNSITVTPTDAFYGNKAATEEEVREALKRAANANLLGERTIRIAIDMGLVTRAGCIMIGSVPHAQIYQL